MVRRRVLDEVRGWGEWCITEDAELGLRIFEQGHVAAYVCHSYGRGLMPDTFGDFKKQRFRWAYGAVTILRSHLAYLLGLEPSRLSWEQRYHFVAGWLPWFADGFNLLFLAALSLAIVSIFLVRPDNEMLDIRVWILVLGMQCIPYAAAMLVALISGLPRLPSKLVGAMGPLRIAGCPFIEGPPLLPALRSATAAQRQYVAGTAPARGYTGCRRTGPESG